MPPVLNKIMPQGTELAPNSATIDENDESSIKEATLVQKMWLGSIFVSVWAFFMLIIFSVAMLINIDWARPSLERLMSQSMHRRVKLQHLNLTIGLDGVAVGSSGLDITDNSGVPLLSAGRSEIGIAIWPLLSGELKIRYLEFKHPELWAIKLSKEDWNFSDLLRTTLDVKYLQTTDGVIHFASLSKANPFKPTDLRNFDLKFVRPSKRFNRPFVLSFTHPKENGTSSQFNLDGLGVGKFADWRENNCKIKLHVKNADLDELKTADKMLALDLSPLAKPLSDRAVTGTFDVDLDGKGVLNKNYTAQLSVDAHGFGYTTSGGDRVTTPELVTHLNLTGKDGGQVIWDHSTVALPVAKVSLRTEGSIKNLKNNEKPTFESTVEGEVENLELLGRTLSYSNVLAKNSKLTLAHLRGKAGVNLHVVNDGERTSVASDVHATDVSINDLLHVIPPQFVAAACLLNLSDQSLISGDIRVDGDTKASFKNCSINNGTFKCAFSGDADEEKRTAKFNFEAKDLPLNNVSENMSQSKDVKDAIWSSVKLDAKNIKLGGKADVVCNINKTGEKLLLETDGQLKNARIVLSDPNLVFDRLIGKIVARENAVKLDHVSGLLNGFNIKLNGNIPASSTDKIDIQLAADQFNVATLASLLQALQVKAPFFDGKQIYGTLHDFRMEIGGTKQNPTLVLSGNPTALVYQPKGLSKPVTAVCGNLTYENDTLISKDVGVALASGTVYVSFQMNHLSKETSVDKMRLKSPGVDVHEIEYYLDSVLAPDAVTESFDKFKKENRISNLHGKSYGDITCQIVKGVPLVKGSAGFVNAGVRYGRQQFNIERLNGLLLFSDDDITVQDITGTLKHTEFTLDAKVPRKPEVAWHGELKATMDPADFDDILPAFVQSVQTNHLDLTANAPIAIQWKASGEKSLSTASFSLNVPADGKLVLSGPFGKIYQPPDQALSIDGALKSDSESVQITDSKIGIGNSSLQVKGNFRSKGNAKHRNFTEAEPIERTHLAIRVPEHMPACTIMQLFNHEVTNNDVSGQLKGKITLDEVAGERYYTGSVNFEKLSFPKFNLKDLSGTLNTAQDESEHNEGMKARIHLQEVLLGGVKCTDVDADFKWKHVLAEGGGEFDVEKCHAAMATGKLDLSGSIDMSRHKFVMHSLLSKASAATVLEELTGAKGEITGILDAQLDLSSHGLTSEEMANNMDGSGSVEIKNGSVSRFGHLQSKLNQGNLIHQGLLGFNLNNLLRTVVPVRTGDFREIASEWQLDNGKLTFGKMQYIGDDLHLTATGQANLRMHTIEMEISGQIPRVSTTALNGTMGELSREITVQKVVNSITLHKLESLPTLPVLGDISSERPRAFSFKILAPYDQPDTISRSIEKSFKWVQTRPNGTVRSIPGIAAN